MNSLQPNGGRRLSTGTGLLLAVLVSVSLVGSAIVQWSRQSDVTPTPVAAFPTGTKVPQEGAFPIGPPTPFAPNVVLSRDHGLWSYVAMRVESGLNVDLSCRCETAQDLEEYVAMMEGHVDKLALTESDMDVLVTFRQPVEPAVFREWVAARGLEASVASLRLSTPEGAHGTLTVSARGGDPLPEAALLGGKRILTTSTILGVYSVRGLVPAERLRSIASDPAVFLADVTPALTRRDLAEAGVQGAQNATINCESPFREMEELGLVSR